MDEPEVIIDQSRENRRFRIRGFFTFFFSLVFAVGVVFTVAAISANNIHEAQAPSVSSEEDDVRYTLVGGILTKEKLTEEDLKKIEEEKKKLAEEAKKKEEEIKIEELKKEEEQIAKKQNESYTPPNGAKIVYLTFDDGPSENTARLLDVLKKYNVKATFFVTCNHANYRNMIKRAYDEGHSIGLHSCSHKYQNVYASDATFFDELASVSKVVKDLTGEETKLFRFPGGSSNTVSKKYNNKIVSRVAEELTKRGYVYFDWNVTSGDAGNTKDTNVVYNNVTRGLKGNYSIVLQHDTQGFSVNAVERIIKFGQEYGFTFKALDTNSPTAHHRINN